MPLLLQKAEEFLQISAAQHPVPGVHCDGDACLTIQQVSSGVLPVPSSLIRECQCHSREPLLFAGHSRSISARSLSLISRG